jgi:class 3 adenylate cyclase/tetratricopeptide (TPR) repeat protein
VSGSADKRAARVFISYRRSDVAGQAGRLYDALSQRLGADQVFMDVDTIPVGVDFAEVLREALDGCNILLALIGKGWTDARDRNDRRRLDLPDDYVRLELETAFERRIPILPVLLQDAEMPAESELPSSLASLARVNALELSDRHWRRDIGLLYETLNLPAGADVSADVDADAETPAVPARPARDVRKLVSVVLAELSAAVGHADRDPEAVDAARRRYFETSRVAIERHGGIVQRFLDDSVVGVFGVPIAHEDDALRATRAASELLDLVSDPALRVATGLDEALDARIVVLTDETVIRSDPTTSLTAGDLVSRAARLQHAAEPNTILLSNTTFSLVESEVEADELDRERAGDARTYRLGRVRRVDEASAPSVGVPLIGRDRELRILERLLDDCVIDETCALVTLLGDAGIGKTRIVAALQEHLGDSARVVIGCCASYGEGITFLPVAQVIDALTGIDRSDGADAVRTKLDAVVARFELPPVAAVGLARLVGNEPPAGEIEESFWAFRSLLEGFARERPLVVVFEDLHWADESVLEVIEHVSDWSTGAPLLIVATARPDLLDRRPEWAGGKRQTTTRTLQPLGPDAARELLDALPHGAALSEPVAGRLLDAAGGVPLFVEEVLAALVQRSVGAAGPEIPTNVVMPQSLSALLEARIDQLTPAERNVLQCASIVGDSVGLAPLTALSALEPAVVGDLLTALVRRDILTITEGDARSPKTVQCRHALLREAAYRSLTKHERATLHESFVAWLDADSTAGGEQREALVARQLELAITTSREIGRATPTSVVERAIVAFSAIVDDANGRGRATSELLTRVEQVAARDETMRTRLGPRLASALADKGDCDTAATIVSEWGADHSNRVQWQLAEAALRTARLSTGDYEAATAILDRLAAADPPLEPSDEIEALHHRGFLATQFGQRAAAVVDFSRAAAIARAESFTHYEIRALRHLVTSAAYGPTPVDELERILDETAARMQQLGSRPAAIARGVALLAAMRGDTERARSALQEYFDLEQTYGLSRHLASHGQDVYDIEWWTGDLDAARVALEASDKQLRLMGADNYRTTVLAQLSRVLARQGRFDEAISAAAEAERLVEPYDSDSLVLLRSAFANAYARVGRFEDAIRAGRDAVAVETDCLLDRGEAFLSYGEALARAARVDDACVAVRRAVDCFERKGALAPLRTSRATLEQLEASGTWLS